MVVLQEWDIFSRVQAWKSKWYLACEEASPVRAPITCGMHLR